MIFDKFLRVISFGSLPRNPGMHTTSFSLFSEALALPYFIFKASAWRDRILQPSLISFVIMFPPKGITAV